jgi:hypothetical protein
MTRQTNRTEFKLRLAARIIDRAETNNAPRNAVLTAIDRQMVEKGDSVWNYFPSEDAFYHFCYDHKDRICELTDELRDSARESAKEADSYGISEGECVAEGLRIVDEDTAMYDDARAKNREDAEFIERCLEACAVEVASAATAAQKAAVVTKYRKAIQAGCDG